MLLRNMEVDTTETTKRIQSGCCSAGGVGTGN